MTTNNELRFHMKEGYRNENHCRCGNCFQQDYELQRHIGAMNERETLLVELREKIENLKQSSKGWRDQETHDQTIDEVLSLFPSSEGKLE